MRKFIPVIAAATLVASACSEDVPSDVVLDTQAVISEERDIECNDFIRNCGYDVYVESDTVPLRADRLFAFVIDGRALAAGQMVVSKNTRFEVAALIGPSDTVPPAPLQHGAIQAFYAKNGGGQFASLLERYGITGPTPSDTVPGPGPLGHVRIGDLNADGLEDVLIYASTKYLSSKGIIAPETQALVLSMVNGKTTTQFSATPIVPLFDKTSSFGK